jgi:uncharacterized protein YyaL (SSP411 family)
VLDYVLAHPREVSIGGDAEAADAQALLDACATGYRPHQIMALGEPGVEPATVPILEGRGLVDRRATTYVCVDFVCQRPVTEPEASTRRRGAKRSGVRLSALEAGCQLH